MAYQNITPPAGEKITINAGKLTVPNEPIVPFIRGDGTGPDDVGPDGVTGVSGIGGENAEFANRGGAGIGKFEAHLRGDDRGAERDDEIRSGVSSQGSTGDVLPDSAIPIFHREGC